MKALIDCGACVAKRMFSEPHHSALDQAFDSEKIDVARVLLAAGADINAEIPGSQQRASTPLAIAGVKGNLDLVELALGEGAKVRQKDKFGREAVWWAAVGSSEEQRST